MNTTRIINQKPNTDITPEDIMFTNQFIPTINSANEITNEQKEQFRRYMETTSKNDQIKKAIEMTKGNTDYDSFASIVGSNYKGNVIEKQKRDVIKIEKESIIDIDTKNRDKNMYPYPSSFKLPLGKTFYNIKSIELVSSAIPNTDQVITNTPIEIRNNRITWENKEDQDLGFYLNRNVFSVGDYVHITIPGHALDTQVRKGKFYIKISKSTTTPSINGTRFAEIVDVNTIRIPFVGGILASGTADIDTGVPNYTVELTPGNYTASTLATEIQYQTNRTKRRNNTGSIFHYFTVTVNLDTDVMTFRSYITKQLSGAPLATTSGTGIITVNSISHGFKTGDYVLILGAKSTGGLTNSVLNGLFQIEIINSDSFTYEVNERAVETGIGGGTTCKTGKPDDFRLIFDTASSLIVNNIGFPNENSSEYIGTSDTLFTTKVLTPSDITIIGDYLRITSNDHGLFGANILTITQVETSGQCTTSTPHLLGDTEIAYVSFEYTEPKLDGMYSITATSDNTFKIDTVNIISTGIGTGLLKYSGDTIKISNLESIPIINDSVFLVENVTQHTFDIKSRILEIQPSSFSKTVIRTPQLKVNHPGHSFNTVTSITANTSTTALITTKAPHQLSGTKFTGSTKISNIINTVDITTATPHLLNTSDIVRITNSVGGADIEGTYTIQVITADIFRITFIGGTDPGTCDVNTGDKVLFTDSNSIPNISSNNLGVSEFYVEYVSPTTFIINTGFNISVPGTFANIGRNNTIAIHRATASEPGGSTLGGIPLTSINHQYYKIIDVIDNDNYLIRVNEYATFTTSSGGSQTVISSINHGFRTSQNNTIDGTESGALYKSISLEGVNYIYLTSPGLQTVFVPGNESVGDIFSRIVLNQPPGLMMFDSFVTVKKEFNPPLRLLKDISFEMRRDDGILFNFNDSDYSISLKIVEIIDKIVNTEFSSNTGVSDLF
jgi:hypothetical protein